MSSHVKVILLGTGNPNPDPNHQGPSILVMVGDTPYVVDFGAGLIRQAAALTSKYGGNLHELKIKNLKTAFLTHLHSDHTIGYPDLILTPWVMGRDKPLEVYGPKGTQELTEHILKAYRDDIHYRVYGLEPTNDLGWQVNVHEIEQGLIYQDDNVQAEAFPVKHGTWPNAYGLRFTTSERVIVISGDTAPCENIIKYGQDADMLFHEVYYKKAFDQKDELWQKYHADHHTSTQELAEIANQIKPKLLVLYHTLFWGGTEEEILAEIADVYSGEVLIGKDLAVY